MAKNKGQFTKGKSGNPKGRPRKQVVDVDASGLVTSTDVREDAWQNTITGVGNPKYDKRMGSNFIADQVGYGQAVELMRGDDVCSKAVRKIVNDALRPGVDLSVSAEVSDPKALQEVIESDLAGLETSDAIKIAGEYERSFGGSAIMLGVTDGQEDLRKPLDLSRVRSLDYLTVYEPREIIPAYYYGNPLAKNFRRVAIYSVSPLIAGSTLDQSVGTFEVHESRIIPFNGIRVNGETTNNGWGESVITALWRVLRDFNNSWDAVGTITQDFAQAVLKIKGLWKIFASNDMTVFQNRMEAIQLAQSVCRMTILDSEEDFERKTVNLGQLPELLDRIESRMAGAANYPVTVLFGRSPGGMNATGEHDMDNYHDTLGDYAAQKILPAYRKISEVLLAVRGVYPDSWKVTCRPFKQMSDKDDAEIKLKHAQAHKIYLDTGVLMSYEVTESVFGGDAYSTNINVDMEAREALDIVPTKEEMAEENEGEGDE